MAKSTTKNGTAAKAASAPAPINGSLFGDDNSAPGADRTHILAIRASNVKSVRVLEITDIGDTLEIRGDTGQGKTTVLESIRAALTGIDPGMIRNGADSAEIILDLTGAKVSRVLRAGDDKDKVRVTHEPGGSPMARPADFLRALAGTNVFNPLEFALMGGGDSKGLTERLRAQRKMLLEALPATLDKARVVAFIKEHVPDAVADLRDWKTGAIDFGAHALEVSGALASAFSEWRTSVNREAAEARRVLSETEQLAPKEEPAGTYDELRTAADADERAVSRRDADVRAREGIVSRKAGVVARLDEARKGLPESLDAAMAAEQAADRALSDSRAAVAAAEEALRKAKADYTTAFDAHQASKLTVSRFAVVTELETTLAGINEELAGDPAAELETAKTKASESAAAVLARKRWDDAQQAKAENETAAARAARFDRLVTLFRDTVPKAIIAEVQMPVEGLAINAEGVVTLNGVPLHQLGTSQALSVAVSVAIRTNPQTGFLCIDRAESLGRKDWLAIREAAKREGVQVLATFVDPEAEPCDGVVVMRNGASVAEASLPC